MKKVNLLLAAVVAASVIAPAAQAYTPNVQMSGYLRSGVSNAGSGKQAKYNVNKIGRLGNENDTYAELAFGADVAKVDDTLWSVNTRFAFGSDGNNGDWQTNIALRELNVSVKGLLDFDKDATIWVGKRFNRRADIHINDAYYWANNSQGAGIDNLSLGSGKFSFSWGKVDSSTAYTDNVYEEKSAKLDDNIFDVEYTFPIWSGASLTLRDQYTVIERDNKMAPKSYLALKDEVRNSNTFGIGLSQGFSGGSFNQTWLQILHGARADATGMSDGYDKVYKAGYNSANGYALFNHGLTKFTDSFGMYHVIYGDIITNFDIYKSGGLDVVRDFGLIVRPYVALTKMTRFYIEAGMYTKSEQYIDQLDNKNIQMQKLTAAYAITPDASNFRSRPEIRFYVTYIHANHEADVIDAWGAGETLQKSDNYVNKQDLAFGAQVEAWW